MCAGHVTHHTMNGRHFAWNSQGVGLLPLRAKSLPLTRKSLVSFLLVKLCKKETVNKTTFYKTK